jgi:hypothetical protein
MRFGGGEFSTGTMRNFQPELTRSSGQLLTAKNTALPLSDFRRNVAVTY